MIVLLTVYIFVDIRIIYSIMIESTMCKKGFRDKHWEYIATVHRQKLAINLFQVFICPHNDVYCMKTIQILFSLTGVQIFSLYKWYVSMKPLTKNSTYLNKIHLYIFLWELERSLGGINLKIYVSNWVSLKLQCI